MHNVGIPTTYRGRVYRSQLEARWAVFFDLLGWPYEYEPFALAGWIPDFILYGTMYGKQQEILVEIKPSMDTQDFPVEKIVKAIQQSYSPTDTYACMLQGLALFKAWRESPDYPANKPAMPYRKNEPECLLLGPTIRLAQGDYYDAFPQLGWLLPCFWDNVIPMSPTQVYDCIDAAMIMDANTQYDFSAEMGSFDLRMTGQENKGRFEPADFATIQSLWNQAGNEVQWRKRVTI